MLTCPCCGAPATIGIDAAGKTAAMCGDCAPAFIAGLEVDALYFLPNAAPQEVVHVN